MSGRVVSDIQTRAEGESLYIRYNTDANVVNNLKNDSSYKFIGEVILKINVVQAEKIKFKVYVNQHESVSHIQIRHAYDFSLCFLHELLMSFLKLFTIKLIVTTSCKVNKGIFPVALPLLVVICPMIIPIQGVPKTRKLLK